MPVSIPFLATQDNFTPQLSLGPSQQIREVRWNVSAPQPAYAQIAKADAAGIPNWDESVFIVQPGPDGFGGDTGCRGIRFKSYSPGVPTVVVATGYFFDDPAPTGLTPSGTSFAVAGGTQTTLISASIVAWPNATPPPGAVLCDGSFYNSIADPSFANMFAVIGIGWGGTSASNFAVPDIRGRTIFGPGGHITFASNDGLALAVRGAIHNTSINDPTHNHGVNDPGHPHNIETNSGTTWSISVSGGVTGYIPNPASTPIGGMIDAALTGITLNAALTGITAGPGGSQPTDTVAYVGMPWIIFK